MHIHICKHITNYVITQVKTMILILWEGTTVVVFFHYIQYN